MTAPELLADLSQVGVEVARAGANLKLCGPREALTPGMLARVRAHKPELLTLLRGAVASPRAGDNRPAVDAPAPGAAARATAGGGRDPGTDAPTPPAGHRPPPDSAGRPPLAPVAHPGARPACGHAGALVVLTVKGRGRICGDCWRLWVQGRLDWPGSALAAERERGQS